MSITPTGLCPQPIGKSRKQGQPILVLHQASVAHLGVAQHLLDIEKGCSTFALTLVFHGSSNCSSWSLPNLFEFDGPIAMGQPPCDPHRLGPSPLPQPRASSLWRSFSEGFSAWMLVGKQWWPDDAPSRFDHPPCGASCQSATGSFSWFAPSQDYLFQAGSSSMLALQ